MQFKGLQLDKFQEDAIKAIDSNHSVIVSAPTGSGKTLIADYIISRDLDKKVIYTAPIKALSNQKYKDFCRDYGEENIGLLTGDIVKNPQANILIMTTEIYRNMLMTDDQTIQDLSYVVFDEIHYISDIERGYVWEESIIFSKKATRFLCLSATIPNAREFADWIQSIKEHEVEVVFQDKRHVPLETSFFDADLGIATLEEIKEIAHIPDYNKVMGGKRQRREPPKTPSHIELVEEIADRLPCLFFCFSRAKCEKMANELFDKAKFQPNTEIINVMREKIDEMSTEVSSLPSARLLRKVLPKGIGFHHAGLIPALKDLVEELFCLGLIKVLYTTETFAVGINMPAKTVCFESLRKFDGYGFRYLTSTEFFPDSRKGRKERD
jgi:ATP-dependent RNA helicase DOB1